MAEKPLKIYFYVFDLIGPQNASIGFGQALQKRGHDVHFLVNCQYKDRFAKFGFPEHNLETPPEEAGENPIKKVCDRIFNDNLFEKQSPIEALRMMSTGVHETFFDKWVAFQPQMKEIIDRDKPDLLVVDSQLAPPALLFADVPFVYLFCPNPLGLFNLFSLPPFTSGLRMDEKHLWKEYRWEKEQLLDVEITKLQTKMNKMFDYPPLKTNTIVPVSDFANVYQFPKELNYDLEVDLPENCLQVDSFLRFESETFELPTELQSKMKPGDKLIYISLGSMGCCNLKLMRRLIRVLGATRHFYIVSKGLLADQFELADNMWGAPKVPQTKVLPLVDGFITHGGNNSTLESFYFGKPMIVFPQFYDQFDNATRLAETGYGFTFSHNNFRDEDLLEAVEKILTDKELIDKYKRMSERIQTENRTEKVVIDIEQRLERWNKKA